jgi:hypothetical protein
MYTEYCVKMKTRQSSKINQQMHNVFVLYLFNFYFYFSPQHVLAIYIAILKGVHVN